MNKEQLFQEYLKLDYETRNIQLVTIDRRETILEDLCTKKIYERFPLSSLCFPAVAEIHMTGSRSEKLCTTDSDIDIMYEIGPALVYPDDAGVVRRFFQYVKDQLIHSSIKVFYLEEADHIGHYRITDSTGGYLYPKDLQTKFYTAFQSFQSWAENTMMVKDEINNQISAATHVTIPRRQHRDDHVLALKLNTWPESIRQTLLSKLTDSHFQKIKGKRFHIYKFLITLLQEINES